MSRKINKIPSEAADFRAKWDISTVYPISSLCYPAAVKGWSAALSAVLVVLPSYAIAAEDSVGAARELARKTSAFAGRGEAVQASWRNASSLGSAELSQARAAFDSALRDAGGRISESGAAVEAHITLSENRTHFLLVEEIRRGDDRQVWIASWKRSGVSLSSPVVALDKKLVWEQDEPMLDVAFPGGAMLVLSPSRVTLFTRAGTQWAPRQSLPLTPPRPWPRDLHGRLRVNAGTFQAYLPGMVCTGGTEPALSMECRAADEPWVLESGPRALLLATFASARNYFDGRVTAQSGQRKNVPPFYSAASVEEQGRALWLLAMVDGRTQLFDAALEPAGVLAASWGSDIAGIDARCGNASPVLATRPGDAAAPDAIQAFAIVNRAAAPLTAPAEFPGPVTALWSNGGSAIAIVHNLSTGRYESYIVSIACS